MTKKLLNRRHALLPGFLSRFDFQIGHRSEKLNGTSDTLTRRRGDLPMGVDERLRNMEQLAIMLPNLPERCSLLADSPHTQGHPSIFNLMAEAYVTDPLPGKIREAI